jgi:hypothetical protein
MIRYFSGKELAMIKSLRIREHYPTGSISFFILFGRKKRTTTNLPHSWHYPYLISKPYLLPVLMIKLAR